MFDVHFLFIYQTSMELLVKDAISKSKYSQNMTHATLGSDLDFVNILS